MYIRHRNVFIGFIVYFKRIININSFFSKIVYMLMRTFSFGFGFNTKPIETKTKTKLYLCKLGKYKMRTLFILRYWVRNKIEN